MAPIRNTSISALSRRRLLKTGAASAAILAAPSVMRGVAAAEDNTVYVGTWGGAWGRAQETYFNKPFTEKTGIKCVAVGGISLAKVKAMVETGTYDFDICDMNYPQAEHDKLVQPMDRSVMDFTNIGPEGILANGLRDATFATQLVYRKDKFPNGGPKNWADFWDVKKFPGKRALNTRPNTILEFALMADGVPVDKVYPLDIERAFKKLNEIKPHITVWWSQIVEATRLIHDGEVDMISLWSSGVKMLKDSNDPVEVVWNQAHLEVGGAFYVIKGTPRAKNAFKYLEFFHDPKQHAEFCRTLAFGPGNPKCFEYMSKEEIALAPTAPQNWSIGVVPDYDWLTPRNAMLQERFSQWQAA